MQTGNSWRWARCNFLETVLLEIEEQISQWVNETTEDQQNKCQKHSLIKKNNSHLISETDDEELDNYTKQQLNITRK